MKWGLLFMLFMVSFGVINLNDAIAGSLGPFHIYGNDLVFAASMLYAALKYALAQDQGSAKNNFPRRPTPDLTTPHLPMGAGVRRERSYSSAGAKPIFSPFRGSPASKAMLAYAALILFLIFRDYQSASAGWGGLQLLIRTLPFYLLFFIIPAFVTCREDLGRVIGMFVLTAGIGNVIIIAQSLHGPGNLFGNGLLGTIFTPPGPQIDYYQYGAFWRSNFPVYFACVWLFFYYAAQVVWSFKLRYLAAVVFFSLAILLNFSRSLYAGIALASLMFFLAAFRRRGGYFRVAILFGLLLAFIVLAAPILGLQDLGGGVVERMLSGLDEMQYTSGTWAGRLDHLALYRELNPDIVQLLLGYGYRGSLALLDLPFLEFGLIDPIYRGGILGTLVLFGVIVAVGRQAVRFIRQSRSVLLFAVAVATLCLVITEVGNLVGGNHFLYEYFGAAVTSGVAILAMAGALEGRDVPEPAAGVCV